ncbi:ABC transporter ATP-binding protein [Naumannella halotolerans]|uniref:Energy-coupling factor transport system ATP-binding protein n=1 Tax=Naumannella halotolerans TaxID=993414 RepID=A0A4R7J341_9ACTN|nr:ATP-binding cassette domain-containing protein [Naumannella halotolerans]TDT30906.1 energy-coupling factor transport system ATP-binding protein [Naumannella halotolerans]
MSIRAHQVPGTRTGARIDLTDWGWRHGSRRRPALAGVDLRIEPGERVLLLGPSGAGKSTLLAGLAGVLGGPDEGEESGSILVDGQRPDPGAGRTGLVLQDPQANTILSRVGDDVAFGCENLGIERSEIWRRVSAALEAVGLDLPLDRSTEALSGGQRQRLALAGVLAMQPGLLLLDEPTANLDPDGVIEVRDAVDRLLADRSATLVVVEHRVSTWLPVVDRIVVLEPAGGVIAEGPPDRVLAAEGEQLAARGVWVPGVPLSIDRRPRSTASGGPGRANPVPLLQATELVSGRDGVGVHDPVEVSLDAGRSTVITGVNGAGKSTLGFTLAGLLPPVAGTAVATAQLRAEGEVVDRSRTRWFERRRPIGPDPARWRARELATRIGVVFQQPGHQFVTATVSDEIAVGLRAVRTGPEEIRTRVAELLAELGLESLAGANPFTLSGGEQRRLSVATVLATAPRLILLDEPTFGQDRLTWQSMLRLIIALVDGRGCAVVSITHDADLIDVLGDQILRLGPADGTP